MVPKFLSIDLDPEVWPTFEKTQTAVYMKTH